MSHTWWLPKLRDGKLGGGLPEQVKEWSEAFQVRAISAPKPSQEDRVHYYIAWKGTTNRVDGTGEFRVYENARTELMENWKRYLDEEFEKQFLSPVDGEVRDTSEG